MPIYSMRQSQQLLIRGHRPFARKTILEEEQRIGVFQFLKRMLNREDLATNRGGLLARLRGQDACRIGRKRLEKPLYLREILRANIINGHHQLTKPQQLMTNLLWRDLLAEIAIKVASQRPLHPASEHSL